MNVNVVIVNGKIIQPIKSDKHYFYIAIQHGDEDITIHIPKKKYRILDEKVKGALKKKDEYVLVEGFIKNESYSIAEDREKHKFIADNIYLGKHISRNVVVVTGVVCRIENQINTCKVKIGLLEGRQMTVVTGSIACDLCGDCSKGICTKLKVYQTVKFVGKIKDKKIVFTDFAIQSSEGA